MLFNSNTSPPVFVEMTVTMLLTVQMLVYELKLFTALDLDSFDVPSEFYTARR